MLMLFYGRMRCLGVYVSQKEHTNHIRKHWLKKSSLNWFWSWDCLGKKWRLSKWQPKMVPMVKTQEFLADLTFSRIFSWNIVTNTHTVTLCLSNRSKCVMIKKNTYCRLQLWLSHNSSIPDKCCDSSSGGLSRSFATAINTGTWGT